MHNYAYLPLKIEDDLRTIKNLLQQNRKFNLIDKHRRKTNNSLEHLRDICYNKILKDP